jgi:hypothetical protein
MEVMHRRCAGVDVHRKVIVVVTVTVTGLGGPGGVDKPEFMKPRPDPHYRHPANTRIALPRSSVISTTNGPTALGRIWRNRMALRYRRKKPARTA